MLHVLLNIAAKLLLQCSLQFQDHEVEYGSLGTGLRYDWQCTQFYQSDLFKSVIKPAAQNQKPYLQSLLASDQKFTTNKSQIQSCQTGHSSKRQPRDAGARIHKVFSSTCKIQPGPCPFATLQCPAAPRQNLKGGRAGRDGRAIRPLPVCPRLVPRRRRPLP